MKLTAAKFALFVFVLLALGMFVAAIPQGTTDEETGGTGTTSPIGGGTGDSPATPGTGKTGGGTTTGGGSKTGGTDTGDTDGGSTTKTPGKSTDDNSSDPPSRTGGGSKTTDEPANGDDTNTNDNDATPKTSQGSGNAKNNNNNNDDNADRNNNNNSNTGNNRNGNNDRNRNGNNNNDADSNDNAKSAKNTETTDNNDPEPANSADSSSPVAQETDGGELSNSTDDASKLALNHTCTSSDSCESGLCQDGKCAPNEKDDDKVGKTLGMALGIIVAVACIGMVLTTAVRMMLKRRRSDYYSKRISELAAPSRATTPSFYHDSTSLVLEKQARNGNYAFNSPEAAISSDSVRPPAQGYYGAADGYDMEQSYTRTGMPNYANDQHLYAPNAPANDWSVTPTYGAFPTTAAPDLNPIPVPQPTMLPVPAMSPIPPRNVQPAADPRSNGSLLTGGAGERDSELIMYGGAASQNLTRESMYDASDDQQNDGGRYKMNSIYSAYGRDSLYADTKDAPSVPDVPDLPSQYQK